MRSCLVQGRLKFLQEFIAKLTIDGPVDKSCRRTSRDFIVGQPQGFDLAVPLRLSVDKANVGGYLLVFWNELNVRKAFPRQESICESLVQLIKKPLLQLTVPMIQRAGPGK